MLQDVTNFDELSYIIPGNSSLQAIKKFLNTTGRIYQPVIGSIKSALDTIEQFGKPRILWLDGDVQINGASIPNIIKGENIEDLIIIKSHKLEDINSVLQEYIYKVILKNNGTELYMLLKDSFVEQKYNEYKDANSLAKPLNSYNIFDLLLHDDMFNRLIDNPKSSTDKKQFKTMRDQINTKIQELLRVFHKYETVSVDSSNIISQLDNGNYSIVSPVGSIKFDGSQADLIKSILDAKYRASKVPSITDEFINELRNQVHIIFQRNPELKKVGSEEQYINYLLSIFPDSVEKSIYWHGSNSDLSEGFKENQKIPNADAPETRGRNDVYLARQPWTVLQYVRGVNVKKGVKRKTDSSISTPIWNNLWWELKEIMSNGRRDNDDWKDIIIGDDTVRQKIPNKKGQFDREEGGKHGKWLSERKADYGYENKSDREFFEEVFGLRWGEDTFNTWVQRNEESFKQLQGLENSQLYEDPSQVGGIFPVIVNIKSPIREEGQDTYYEDSRGLFTTATNEGNDAIISKKADNEFGSDVVIMLNHSDNPNSPERIHFLGTPEDIRAFTNWMNNDNITYVQMYRKDIEQLAKTILTSTDSLGHTLNNAEEQIRKQLEQLLMC